MKKIHLSLIMFSVVLLSIMSSCKKSSDNSATCGSGLLCATVDGTSYTASPYNTATTGGFFGVGGTTTYNGSYAQLVPNANTIGGYNLVVVGNNGTASEAATYQLDFTIKELPTNGGVYTTTGGSVSFDYDAGSTTNQLHYVSDSTHTGTVTITSIDTVNNYITGTFSYTGFNSAITPTTHTITSGSFTKILVRR